jgi:quinoprotein glucose dehydrogenase
MTQKWLGHSPTRRDRDLCRRDRPRRKATRGKDVALMISRRPAIARQIKSQAKLFWTRLISSKIGSEHMTSRILAALIAFLLLHAADAAIRREQDWPAYGGGPEGIRYSTLSQINRANVSRLQVAWSYDTADGAGDPQTQPIMVGDILFGLTPKHKVIALDAATGKLKWRFDSGIEGRGADRGVVYWRSGGDQRIFAGVQSFIYALDAHTGLAIPTFGKSGRIDLREGLDRDPAKQSIVLTSPGIIYKDLLIVGGRTPEALPAPPGDIRAFDVRTGQLRWQFHTIPRPGEFGFETWPKDAWTYTGAANNWPGMAVDTQRGVVYVPTGSAASDFYGADRTGDDLFANCLIALKADTGERIWHFQSVKHDIWDRDFPSPPALVRVRHEGRMVDAVAQTTKSGFVYLFDRVTGKPLFPIEYRKYPASDVPGEVAAETQPLPTRPAPFARQLLTEAMLSNRTPEAHQWALDKFRALRSAGQFVPLTIDKETVIFPGFDGGAEWGGSAFDPQTGLLYVNANDVAWTSNLAENKAGNSGRQIYLSNCANCHGDGMLGAPPSIPSIVDLRGRRSPEQVTAVIRQGGGRMPSFTNLRTTDVAAITQYLLSGESKELESTAASTSTPKYRFTGYHKFLDPDGYPAIAPPWGTLNAINLNTGEYAWKIPLGEYPALATQGLKNTGTENYGGPIVTAGGLVFIAATNFDKKFRAFDKQTGRLLWETTLPFAGNATPITYEVDGRQYVVIYATGGKSGRGGQSGGIYVAFALRQ